MTKEASKARLKWVQMYLEKKDSGFVCRRCGISRPTLRKWVKRFQEHGVKGLEDQSRRPKTSPNTKVTQLIKELILEFRRSRNLGARRIQNELIRHNDIKLSLDTIHKVLERNEVQPIKRPKRKKEFKRYSRPVPGDRVQVDTCKIAPGIYQYTAIDDCTRWRVLELYTRRTGKNTELFIEKMIEEFPFPIQRIQSDRGREFFAFDVQRKMMKYSIKFRPNKPRSPHLNGKVERSQKTDFEEFYGVSDLSNFEQLKEDLGCWQFFYNWHRPHGALNGKTPCERSSELSEKTPFWDEVIRNYDRKKERLQEPVYAVDQVVKMLK